MKNIAYLFARLYGKLCRKNEIICNYFRKQGIKIGRNCNIFSNITTSEPFLIEIGDTVTISTQVVFVTHDHSIYKVDNNCYNLFGKIKIGNNCFLGERSTFMYGVELADNIIVAAGSVVTHSFKAERVIIGGNPAKIIGTWDDFLEKNKGKAASSINLKQTIEKHPEILVTRKVKE